MYEANAVVLLELYVIYLMIVAGGHLDILAMRLSKLGTSVTEATNANKVFGRETSCNDLIDNIKVHKAILKLF